MIAKPPRRALLPPSGGLLLAALAALCVLGCQDGDTDVQLDNPELAAFVRLMMPAKIEIQHYLTKPFDFEGTGDANGIEVILAALDSFGDPVKCVGTFQFELHTRRMASGDKFDQRIAFWPVRINSDKTLVQYWDRLARFYRFPLKLGEGALRPGRYILSARLITPTNDKLVDDYEFTYEGP